MAEAILTTDTVRKEVAARLVVDDRTITIGGMAKGSGMIAPNMATLLGFLTTDAAVDARALQLCLHHAVEHSFNRLVVDGDQSTNDTVLFLANGLAGNRLLDRKHPAWHAFCRAVDEVCRQLALKLIRDAEGATKLITVRVSTAASRHDARLAARAIACSPLVKTAWHGADPNWGRIVAALGYSGARFQESQLDIACDGLLVVKGGKTAEGVTPEDLRSIYTRKEFVVRVELHAGRSEYTVYTCDLSPAYVEINAAYMT